MLEDTPFDNFVRLMKLTAETTSESYAAAAKESMHAKLDPEGEMKLHTLVAKVHAFCDTNDIDRMSFDDFDDEFLAARGLRLVFPHNGDPVVRGVSAAPQYA